MTASLPSMQITDLTCEYLRSPLGIDVTRPRFSWKIVSNHRGRRQVAYRILAAEAPGKLEPGPGLLWDSGRVESDRSTHVLYDGAPLHSRQQVWWAVMVWNELSQPARSEPAFFEMGLLDAADWQAEWIGSSLTGGPSTSIPAPYLRRGFGIEKPVRQARLYVTALGLYECYLNGQRVSGDYFTPGWTDYRKRVQYQTYDVTSLLKEGENALGTILGDGWYCGHVAWRGRQIFGDRPRLLAQLEIQYTDGSHEVIASGPDWRLAFGPILASDLLMGESYDARQEMPGWNEPDFNASAWQPVTVFQDMGAKRSARRGPAVRRILELRPVSDPVAQKAWPVSRWIYDLGQNMVGWVRLKVQGPAGTTITLRFAEMLNADGSLYTTNLRAARATDTYTLKGGEEEIYEPRFTFHGFRYVEVSGYPGTPDRETITGVVLHSDMPVTGAFECSDPLINQLQHNIQWGQRGNFLDVPTDCPQRDERLGWTGDAQVFIRTAAFNMNVAPFFTKWIQDLEDAQTDLGQIPPFAPNINPGVDRDGGPAWSDAFTICPWTIYQCFGDEQILVEHYPRIKRYVDHLVEMSPGLIRCHPDSSFQNGDWEGYGDWLSTQAETSKELIGTAFLAYSARLLAQMASVLDNAADQQCYEKIAADVHEAFIHRFVTPGGLVSGQTQTAYVLALHFDLLPDEMRASAVSELVRDIHRRGDHLSTGFVGSPYLPHVLTQAGRSDIAYTLLNQKSWPSWLYPVTKGATTIWERWDGWTDEKGFQDPGMNSFNHYAYGSIGDWLYSVVAGINVDPARPGYKHIFLRPQPGGGLRSASANYESLYGRVSSGWKFEGDTFFWDVIVPPNTEATLWFPAPKDTPVNESGKPAEQAPGLRLETDADHLVYQAAAGRYHFTLPAAAVDQAG